MWYIPVCGMLTGFFLRTFGVFFLEKMLAFHRGEDLTFDKHFLLEPLVAMGIVVLGTVIAIAISVTLLEEVMEMSFQLALIYAFFAQTVTRFAAKYSAVAKHI